MSFYEIKTNKGEIVAVAGFTGDSVHMRAERLVEDRSVEEFHQELAKDDLTLSHISPEAWERYCNIWPKANEEYYLVYNKEGILVATASSNLMTQHVVIRFAEGTTTPVEYEGFVHMVFQNSFRVESTSIEDAERHVIAWSRHREEKEAKAKAKADLFDEYAATPPDTSALEINIEEPVNTEKITDPVSEFTDLIKAGWLVLHPFQVIASDSRVRTAYQFRVQDPRHSEDLARKASRHERRKAE